MGKLKFTLSNIWFWLALMGITVLAANLEFLTSSYTAGLNLAPVFIVSFIGIGSLLMYFFINHKENKLKFDYVLFPICILLMIAYIVAVWGNGSTSYPLESGEGNVEVLITNLDKIKSTLVVVMFFPFMYALLFVLHRNVPNSKAAAIMWYVGIIFVYVAIIFSYFSEKSKYALLFSDTKIEGSINISSFFFNKNEYGAIIFVGVLICMIINYHKPRLIWYLSIVFLTVNMFASAAMAPIIVTVFMVPIYLIEEIIRHSVKKKWHLSIFSTIAALSIFAIALIFYIGVVKEWKGFMGLNSHVTEMIYSKDYKTLTGRTIIWEHLIPYMFDNPLHILLGHGFIISQNHIYGITSTFAGAGVKTAHNGYIQVLFEFGAIGLAINVFLICYFIYSLIRLLLEKRFHFVFVYGLAALGHAVYNIGESSAIFTYGIKEVFVTILIFVPVMARAKLLGRKKVVEEAMNLDVESMSLDPIKLGKAFSVIIVSFMIALVPLFFTNFMYSHQLLKLFGMIEGGLFLLLLFVPYLLSLYYRNTEKSHFVMHCVFNAAGLFLVVFLSVVPLWLLGHRTLPLALGLFSAFLYLIVDTVLYTLIKKGSFKEYLRVFVVGSFVHTAPALAATFILGVLFYLLVDLNGLTTWFTFLFGIIVNLMMFYIFLYFLPILKGREVINEFNKLSLLSIKRLTIKDETTYG